MICTFITYIGVELIVDTDSVTSAKFIGKYFWSHHLFYTEKLLKALALTRRILDTLYILKLKVKNQSRTQRIFR